MRYLIITMPLPPLPVGSGKLQSLSNRLNDQTALAHHTKCAGRPCKWAYLGSHIHARNVYQNSPAALSCRSYGPFCLLNIPYNHDARAAITATVSRGACIPATTATTAACISDPVGCFRQRCRTIATTTRPT